MFEEQVTETPCAVRVRRSGAGKRINQSLGFGGRLGIMPIMSKLQLGKQRNDDHCPFAKEVLAPLVVKLEELNRS